MVYMHSIPDVLCAQFERTVGKKTLIGSGGAPVMRKFADEVGTGFEASEFDDAVRKCNQLLR